ncbi:MAG: TRAP transporter substrate-binding protein DctP [Propioniciclava sp.]
MKRVRCAGPLLALGLLILTSACTGAPGPSSSTTPAAETTLRLAFPAAADSPQAEALATFSQDLDGATAGRVQVEIRPDQALGRPDSVLQAVSDGSIAMAVVDGPTLASLNEDVGVFQLPYLFDSPEAQAAALADPAARAVLDSLAQPHRISVLTGLYGGTRNIYTTERPVRTPDDLAGLTLRVDSSQMAVSMIEQMGAVAVPMKVDQVARALTAGTLQGAEDTTMSYQQLGHSQTAGHYSYTRHLMIPDYLIVNTDQLADLNRADRDALSALIPALVEQTITGTQAAEVAARRAAEAAGATFYEDVDAQAFALRTETLVAAALTNPERVALHEAVQKANEAHP